MPDPNPKLDEGGAIKQPQSAETQVKELEAERNLQRGIAEHASSDATAAIQDKYRYADQVKELREALRELLASLDKADTLDFIGSNATVYAEAEGAALLLLGAPSPDPPSTTPMARESATQKRARTP